MMQLNRSKQIIKLSTKLYVLLTDNVDRDATLNVGKYCIFIQEDKTRTGTSGIIIEKKFHEM